jgi:predicted aldo/keto reductase-like oxidoreductase
VPASEARIGAFTDTERGLVETIKAIIREKQKVGCTGCRYCMPCPQGVDIPGTFHYYNLMYFEKKRPVRYEYARNVGMRTAAGFATQCVGCGKCETHCPQKLPIRALLKEADRDLRPPVFRLGISVARKALKRG